LEEQVKTHIKAQKGWAEIPWKEIWDYRDLLYFLTIRNLKAKYAQSILGTGWAILQPLLYMGIFTLVFGKFAQLDSEGRPYALFTLAAIVPWSFFSAILSEGSQSLVQQAPMLSKVYFPRIILPLSAGLAKGWEFIIGFLILIFSTLFVGIFPDIDWLFFIPMIFLLCIAAFGLAFFFAALAIQFRDVKYALPFLIQLLFFASPIVYSTSIVPESILPLYAFNPLVGIIEGFRAAFFHSPVPWHLVIPGVFTASGLFVFGLLYFHRAERNFADLA
jgi:lipopolysaccharide transport system permease protein